MQINIFQTSEIHLMAFSTKLKSTELKIINA